MSPLIEAEAEPDVAAACSALAARAKAATRALAIVRGEAKDAWLRASAEALGQRVDEILAANALDVAAAPAAGLNAAAIDRLTLNPKRIAAMAGALREVAALPDPLGEVVASSRRPNGLEV